MYFFFFCEIFFGIKIDKKCRYDLLSQITAAKTHHLFARKLDIEETNKSKAIS